MARPETNLSVKYALFTDKCIFLILVDSIIEVNQMNKLSTKKRFNPDKLENRTVCPYENVLARTNLTEFP